MDAISVGAVLKPVLTVIGSTRLDEYQGMDVLCTVHLFLEDK